MGAKPKPQPKLKNSAGLVPTRRAGMQPTRDVRIGRRSRRARVHTCCSRPLPGPPGASEAGGGSATSCTQGAELPGRAQAGARCAARPPPLPARPMLAIPAMQHPTALPAMAMVPTHMPHSTGSSSGTRWCAALLSSCVGAGLTQRSSGQAVPKLPCCDALPPWQVPVSYLDRTKPLAVAVLGRQLAVWCAR